MPERHRVRETRRRGRRPRVLFVAGIPDDWTDTGRWLLEAARGMGADPRVRFLVWNIDDVPLTGARVRSAVDFPDWWLAVGLTRLGLVRVARRAKNLRQRWWWRTSCRADWACLVGAFPPTLLDFVPPGTPRFRLPDRPLPPDSHTDDWAPRHGGQEPMVDWPVLPRDLATASERQRAKERLVGTTTDRPLIVGFGEPRWTGGVDLFLQLAHQVSRGHPEALYAWLGEQPFRGPLAELVTFDTDRLQLRDSVLVLDRPRLDPVALEGADVIVGLARRGPLPLLVHAAARGVPVVAFAGSAHPDLAGDATDIPFGRLDVVADAVAHLLGDPAHLAATARAANLAHGSGAVFWQAEHAGGKAVAS